MVVESIQLLFSVVTIMASGFGAFMGVKIAITRLEGDLKLHAERLSATESHLSKLESQSEHKLDVIQTTLNTLIVDERGCKATVDHKLSELAHRLDRLEPT